jgi:TetR/AcrR family transcriptional regulator, copper-responsive repressor
LSTSRPARGRPKTFDRERTLEVAVDGYWRDGPAGVSVNEICRRAGVSKPGVYREFGNEDGLMNEALATYTEMVLRPLLDQLETDQPFTEALDSLIDFMTTQTDTGIAGCMLAKMRVDPSKLGPLTHAQVEWWRSTVLNAYTNLINRARRRGDIDPSLSVELAARFLDAQFNHILGQMAAGEEPTLVRAQAQLAFAGITRTPTQG